MPRCSTAPFRGNGYAHLPITIVYDDDSTQESEFIFRDWYGANDEGLVAVIDGMDRQNAATGELDDANNPALFLGKIALDDTKVIKSITVRPNDSTVDWATATVVCSLMAISVTDATPSASTSCNGSTVDFTCPPSWKLLSANEYGFADAYDNCMAYFCCYLNNLTGAPLELMMRHKTDDACTITIDNVLWAYRTDCCSWLTTNILVAPGEHRLMMKVFEGGGGFNGAMRLFRADGFPLTPEMISITMEPTQMTSVPSRAHGYRHPRGGMGLLAQGRTIPFTSPWRWKRPSR